jgi:hypothetical protein
VGFFIRLPPFIHPAKVLLSFYVFCTEFLVAETGCLSIVQDFLTRITGMERTCVMPNKSKTDPFLLKDCALIAIAAGKKAQNLRELREHIRNIDLNSLYYHFWGGLLRPRFDNPEYHNDFAIWVAHALHNRLVAERLAVIDPMAYETLEDLRTELIETIEECLDEIQFPTWAGRDDQFEFVRYQIVIFDTNITVTHPEDLVRVFPRMPVGSIFYHFIEGRRRNRNSLDDFRNWLMTFGDEYAELGQSIGEICPYFTPLRELRKELIEVCRSHF